MPSSLSVGEVERIAALANLELDASELDLFARQLGDILTYVEELQSADTTGVPPTAGVVTRHTADRADVVAPSLDVDAATANAPDAERVANGEGFDVYYKVPQVIG